MMTRTAQPHQAGHMQPAGHVFETPGLKAVISTFLIGSSKLEKNVNGTELKDKNANSVRPIIARYKWDFCTHLACNAIHSKLRNS